MNLLPFRVYQILSEYTDGDHALAMGELLRLLRTEYGLRCDRRAVYAALDKLRTVGCHIPEYQDDGEGYRLLPFPGTIRGPVVVGCCVRLSGNLTASV